MGLFGKKAKKQSEDVIPHDPSIAFQCDKCGWKLAEGEPIPAACPVCGDPIDEDDIA